MKLGAPVSQISEARTSHPDHAIDGKHSLLSRIWRFGDLTGGQAQGTPFCLDIGQGMNPRGLVDGKDQDVPGRKNRKRPEGEGLFKGSGTQIRHGKID